MLSESHSQGHFSAKRIWVLLGLMICVMAYSGVTVQGQTIFGRISGSVKDSNGSAIPNATITIGTRNQRLSDQRSRSAARHHPTRSRPTT